MFSLTHVIKANARNLPDSPSTVMGARHKTWKNSQDTISRFASGLRDMGVADGDRVAILALNSDRYFEGLFSTWWSGGVAVPLNIRLSIGEQVIILKDSGAKVLLIDNAFLPMLETLRQEVVTLEQVVFIGDGDLPVGTTAYEKVIAQNSPCDDALRKDDDLAGLYYTGGTTGTPKGVMLSHRALMFNNLACSAAGNYSAADIYLHAAPMFHTADSANSGAATLFGATHTFLPVFDPGAVISMIQEHKVTATVLVPTMIAMVLDHPDFSADKLSSLRRLIYGASPMPQALLLRLIETFPELEIIQGYGMTEMGPLISILPADDHTLDNDQQKRLKSAGRPAAGIDVKICDDQGQEVSHGLVGEIAICSPGHMTGYWNKPEATAEVLKDEWVFSGDCGYLDDDGYLFIVDRKKDMIVTGGENVYSAEVENAISMHPGVAAVAVIGIPSEQWGETVHAVIVKKPDADVTEDAIFAHTKSMIANYKVPRSISFREQPFPLSGAGKVLKRELRAPFWQGLEKSV